MSTDRGTILFLSHDATQTGAPIFLLRFLRWFGQNKNINFRTLVGNSGDLFADFEALGTTDSFEPNITLYYRALRRLQLHRAHASAHVTRLREELLHADIRLIYANSIASAKMVNFLSFLDCPVICHVHELDWVIQDLGVENLRILENRGAQYIAVSHAVRNNLVRNHGISAKSIQVIHGFIPVTKRNGPEEPQANDNARRMWGIPARSKIVCACGSIESRKGTDLFLRVAEDVIGKHHACPIHFIWIGGDAAKVQGMRKQVANSSLAGMVHFVGHQSDVTPYLKATDIFLLTSREDPFPLVMMEAALHQKPIICFDQAGGAPEFVDKDAGFVVPAFDIDKMADKVVELLLAPELCDQMGMVGAQKVLSRHNLDTGAATIAAAIEGALRSDTTAPHAVVS